MTVPEMRRFAFAGCALCVALGLWNFITFWQDPADDSVSGMLVLYVPTIVSWSAAGFVAGRRTGGLPDAARAGSLDRGRTCSSALAPFPRALLRGASTLPRMR